MKHKLNSFSGAFEGTTKGLEGIANALKREEPTPPVPPEPYVPTGYPAYIKFINTNNNAWAIYEIKLGFVGDNICIQSDGIDPDFQIGITLRCQSTETTDIIFNNKGNFSFTMQKYNFISQMTITPSNYSYEWVDPSTLPQS